MSLAGMPDALQEVALRALDAEAESSRAPLSAETIHRREKLLRGTQAVLDAWRGGELSTDEAIVRIERLIDEDGNVRRA